MSDSKSRLSKEEREDRRWVRRRLEVLRSEGSSQAAINIYTVSDWLNKLDAADERIAELEAEAEMLKGKNRSLLATLRDIRSQAVEEHEAILTMARQALKEDS